VRRIRGPFGCQPDSTLIHAAPALSAHGGYLLRPEGLRSLDLVEVARSALALEGQDPSEASIQVSVLRSPGVLRVAFDAPFTPYGRRGALWYRDHHAFARLTSERIAGAAHVYAIDADTFESVTSYASGHKVGGDSVVYDEVEMDFGDDEGTDVTAFEEMRARWPIGHLGQIFGVTRDELLHLPWNQSVLLPLRDGVDDGERRRLSALILP
jgi:hypothetical protein